LGSKGYSITKEVMDSDMMLLLLMRVPWGYMNWWTYTKPTLFLTQAFLYSDR